MPAVTSDNKSKMTPTRAAIIGGISGAIEITAAYPAEFTKVIMQLYPKYNKMGAWNVFKYTIRKDGFFGLFKGYNLLLTAGVPKSYIRFGVFEYMTQNVFEEKNLRNTTIAGVCAGALEGLLIHVPVENMKVKLIHDRFVPNPQFRNMFHGIYTIAKERGIKGMTRGWGINTAKEGSNHAIRFPLFLGLQKLFAPRFKSNVMRDMVAGTITGILCVAINQPLDTIKTNLQGLRGGDYKNSLDCAQKILANEGVSGLYKGIRPRMARVGIEVGVTFASYNAIIDFVNKYLDGAE